MTQLGTRLLKIKVGATEHTASVSRCEVTSGPADAEFTSFADAAAGGAREYALDFTGVQDLATASLWRYLWDNAGETVAVRVNPYGVATATADTPFFEGNVTVTEPDGTLLGGEANPSTKARMTFEARWVFTAKPTEDTSGTWDA